MMIEEHSCETCKWGEWYRRGYDTTMMDDECGGCCSWNDKWKPIELKEDKRMREIIMWLGSILISAFIMAFPILTTLSFVYDWNSFLKFIFLSATVMFLAMFAVVLKANADGSN